MNETGGGSVVGRFVALSLLGFVALVALIAGACTYTPVEEGHVALVYQGGAIVGEKTPGFNFVAPWQQARDVNLQEQKAFFFNDVPGGEGGDNYYGRIDAGSEDTQNVYISATVNWQIDAQLVRQLYGTQGANFFEKLVTSRVRSVTKDVVATYDAVDVTRSRAKIAQTIVDSINATTAPLGVRLISMQLDNVSYSPEFEAAIEDKQVATQNALRAQEEVAQREAEARGTVAEARGRADAAIEAARGNAEAIRINAEAQAAANALLSASLTPALIQSQALGTWDGKMPAFLPAGGGVLVDPAALLAR